MRGSGVTQGYLADSWGSLLTGSIDTNRIFSARRSYCCPFGITVKLESVAGPEKMGFIPSPRQILHAFLLICVICR